MPLDATRQRDFEECFEIIGHKAKEVDVLQLATIMRSLGQNPTTKEVEDMFGKAAKGEANINLEKVLAIAGEFEGIMKATNQTQTLTDAFKVFDKDKSSKISAAELKHVITNLGQNVDEDEMEAMMAEADKDGNGSIDYNEFVKVLLDPCNIPPPVSIPDDLKEYWVKVHEKAKSDKDKKTDAAKAEA